MPGARLNPIKNLSQCIWKRMNCVVLVWYRAIVSVESETHTSSQELKRLAIGQVSLHRSVDRIHYR
jgi:hypothetical protein